MSSLEFFFLQGKGQKENNNKKKKEKDNVKKREKLLSRVYSFNCVHPNKMQ